MIGLTPGGSAGGLREILCLGAHSDDIEIGCGGAVLELIAANPGLRVTWVVFSGDARREAEARRAARRLLKNAGSSEVIVRKHRDGFFPQQTTEIKEFFETLKSTCAPDLIFTHYRNDRHQDHRTISDLTWNTFRNHFVLEYEIPKFDGDLGTPNLFVPVRPQLAKQKVACICTAFESQFSHHWFTPDLFLGVMRLRGIECCSQYAEAFHARKTVLATASPRASAKTTRRRRR